MNRVDLDWRELLGNSDAVVILGMGPQALFLLRELRHFYSKIYLIGSKNWIGYYSRFGNKIVCSTEEIQKEIETIVGFYGKETPIIFSGGYYLRYYLANQYLSSFNCFPKPFSKLGLLNDKMYLYDYVRKIDSSVKLLDSFLLTEMVEPKYPVILKWKTDVAKRAFKTIVVKEKQHFHRLKQRYLEQTDDIIVQSYLTNKRSIAWAAYCNKGEPLKQVVVDQIRQYPVGLTNCVVDYKREKKEQILSFCSEIVRNFVYTGFIEIEFLQDRDNLQLYLLEVNPRPWGWIDYLKYSTKEANNKPMINMLRDIVDIWKNRSFFPLGKLIPRAVRYFGYNKAIWASEDPLPLLGQILNRLYKIQEM
jgi:predicted ATP-grasp superfamily ATP-dependent carboligase